MQAKRNAFAGSAVRTSRNRHPILIVCGATSESGPARAVSDMLAALGINARVVVLPGTGGRSGDRDPAGALRDARGAKVVIALGQADPSLPSRLAGACALPVLAVLGEVTGRRRSIVALERCLARARSAPYGTLALGLAGARNAALAAAAILALDEPPVRRALLRFRAGQTRRVLAANRR